MTPIPDHERERIAMEVETDDGECTRIHVPDLGPKPTEAELWADVEAVHPDLRPELERILAEATTELEKETSR